MLTIQEKIIKMPKVELHVHLEGSIQPETLLELANRNAVELPAGDVKGLREWYHFTDFDHFIEVYFKICECIQTPADMELIAKEFLCGQAEQNILYSEVVFTPYTHFDAQPSITFENQIQALFRAAQWAKETYGIEVRWAPDFSRNVRPVSHAETVAEWAASARDLGIIALGVGGPEVGHPPELFTTAFKKAAERGLFSLPHAGETEGPPSIWGAIHALNANRIGHGVRCLEDPELVKLLRKEQIPLDVCPTSNVCLKVVPDLESHPLPQLLNEGLLVTINSDDPPMFNTTLTKEYLAITETFNYDWQQIQQFVLNGVQACLLPEQEKLALMDRVKEELEKLG